MPPSTKKREPKNDLEAFATELRSQREKMKHSQSSLARAIGVSSNTIYNIEASLNWPSIPVYISLCRILKVGAIPLIS